MTATPWLRASLAAGAAAFLLAGCEAQPIGTFDEAQVTSANAQAQVDLYFRPGTPHPLPGETERMNAFLRALLLRSQDDVIVTFGTTGSDRLDAARMAAVRQAIASDPARLRFVGPLGFGRAPGRNPDIVLVQAVRYDRVVVTCPGSGRTNENPALLTPIPVEGCANPVNIATMAADKRDLTAPRRLEGSDAFTSVGAVERYRVGDVTVEPLSTVSSGN
jgi:type IV pilus biogenesis protein CpaD/CtpE